MSFCLFACPYSGLLRGGGDVDTEVLLAREVRAVKIPGGGCCDMYNNPDIGERFLNFQQIAKSVCSKTHKVKHVILGGRLAVYATPDIKGSEF